MKLDARRSRLAATGLALLGLLGLCLASTAQAATRMYTGSLIIHSFGNDTTTGTDPPFDTGYAVGIPLTGQCNTAPYHAKEYLQFSLPQGTPTYTVSFTVPKYGGRGTDTNGDTIVDILPTGCGATTIETGDPLTGVGPVNTTEVLGTLTNRATTDPRGFTLPRWALRKEKNTGHPYDEDLIGSFEQYGVYLWEIHHADLHNEEGVFAKSGGDGNFGPIAVMAAKQKRSVTQTAGGNQFGGTMRLLGVYGDSEGYLYNNTITSVYPFNWLFHYLGQGGQAVDGGGEVTDAYHTTYVNFGYTKTSGYPTTSTVYQSVFKWTTGTVDVTALGGTFPTILQRKGYDNRNAKGSGVVQLVSPQLTKWVGAGTTATAAIGILKVEFAPEPSEWLMLASGVSFLGLIVLRRRNRRS